MKGHLFFDYLPLSWHGKNSVVGFDVAEGAVRFVKLEHARDGVTRVADFGKVEFTASDDDVDLVKKLAAIKNKRGFSDAAIVLPNDRALSVKMRLPASLLGRSKLAESNLRAAVGHRLAEEMFCLPAEISFDYDIFRDQPMRDFIDLNASAVPIGIVEKRVEIFRRAGFVPVSLAVKIEAIKGALIKKDDKRAYMIVDIGKHMATLAVIAADSIWFSVTEKVRTPVADFAELGVVARAMRDAVVIYRGNLEDDEDKPLFAPSSPAVTRILVCGSRATEPGLVDHLAHAVGIPATLANPWQNIVDFDEYIPPISRSESLEYAAAIGAAISNTQHK